MLVTLTYMQVRDQYYNEIIENIIYIHEIKCRTYVLFIQ